MEKWPRDWPRSECLNRVFQEVQKIDFFSPPLKQPLGNLPAWKTHRKY